MDPFIFLNPVLAKYCLSPVWAEFCLGGIQCGRNPVGGILSGWNPVWVESCLGGIMPGWNPVGGILSGWNLVWVEFCLGGILWVEFCLGGILSGRNSVGWNTVGGILFGRNSCGTDRWEFIETCLVVVCLLLVWVHHTIFVPFVLCREVRCIVFGKQIMR